MTIANVIAAILLVVAVILFGRLYFAENPIEWKEHHWTEKACLVFFLLIILGTIMVYARELIKQ